MNSWKNGVLAVGAGLVLVGLYGLLRPPGLFWFAATDCPPTGDCASYIAPMLFSILSVVCGGLILAVASVKAYLGGQ